MGGTFHRKPAWMPLWAPSCTTAGWGDACTLVRGCDFEIARFRGHSFVETTEVGYMLTIVDRAIDTSHASGRFGDDMAAALKAEARRRVEAGTFFGHIAYVSLAASKTS